MYRAGIRPQLLGAKRTGPRANSLHRLISYVDYLPPRERHIITEHYFRKVKFKDIATELGISEPRVSQIHTRAIKRLRKFANDHEL